MSPRGSSGRPTGSKGTKEWAIGAQGVKGKATTAGAVIFRAGVLSSIKNAKCWPILTNFGHFVANITRWCTFSRPKESGGVPKLTNMRYGEVWR